VAAQRQRQGRGHHKSGRGKRRSSSGRACATALLHWLAGRRSTKGREKSSLERLFPMRMAEMTANTTAEVRGKSCIELHRPMGVGEGVPNLMKRLVLTVVAMATVALFGCVSPVLATPITYTETVTGTGTLDGTAFVDALVTLTLTGDTSTVLSGTPYGLCTPGPCYADPGSATVHVVEAGINKTDTFTDSMVAWDNPLVDSMSIFDVTLPGSVLYINDPVFSTYQLLTSIGPVSGLSGLFAHTFPTTSGNFTMTSVAATATFTATESSAPVPEPASLLLLGTGLAAVARRRFKRRA
jgi:hypothetical protein